MIVKQTLTKGYSWKPSGIFDDKIEKYFSQIPKHKVPLLGTPGEKYRESELIRQLPKQDLGPTYCKYIESQNLKLFEEFVSHRNECALDIGYIREDFHKILDCRHCKKAIAMKDMAVIAPKFGDEVCWHPTCFVCSVCQELLVDLTYCAKEGKLFCERHYAETIKPRCCSCDEVRDGVFPINI